MQEDERVIFYLFMHLCFTLWVCKYGSETCMFSPAWNTQGKCAANTA